MREIEDFTDDRLKAWCIHCGDAIADVESNRDHVPTKSLLTKTLRERGANYDRKRASSGRAGTDAGSGAKRGSRNHLKTRLALTA